MSGASWLNEIIALQDRGFERTQSITLEQERELAEPKGMVCTLVSIQRPGERR